MSAKPNAPQTSRSATVGKYHLTQGVMQQMSPHRLFLAGASIFALMLTGQEGAFARSLGGGGGTMSAPTIASDAAAAAARQATEAARQSEGALARAAQALQALQAAQAAARNAAASVQRSNALPQVVPNGLAPGGLQIAPGAVSGAHLWRGADLPVQSAGGDQTTVTVNQTAQQAVLNWQTFNVGSRTTVNFNQQGNDWSVLNRVVGNAAGPSQILGRINAPGQVLVVNQNGIIFGGASQINVGSLVASAAGITDTQFLVSGIYSTRSGQDYVASFKEAAGRIVVEAGASIATSAPTSVKSGGGFVALLGSNVDNAGSIVTPKGQTLLAAGDDFILRPGLGTDSNQVSTTRGNEVVPVLRAGSASGAIGNTGLVFAPQGDITLAGHAITQSGVLMSTTSVNQRGTIHLLNSASDAGGTVTLAGSGITLILPELDSAETALNSQRDALIADSAMQNAIRATQNPGQFDNLSRLADRGDRSRVEIVSGGLVDLQNGSLTVATGGQVAISAGKRVFAGMGAVVDVSGAQGVLLPMSANAIKVNIQGNELRDSPQNRDGGALINKDVWIDARDLVLIPAGTGGYASKRYYTAGGLLEVGGYLNNTGHKIGEWAAVGGDITLSAPEVVAQRGSTFNIGGGAVQYEGGYLPQTNLLGRDGRYYNLNNAPADLTYTTVAGGFVVNHERWNVVEVYSSVFDRQNMRWEDGYTVGRDAGRLILSTPTSVFEGAILADVIKGRRQIAARPADISDGYELTQNTAPLSGSLALGLYDARGLVNASTTAVKFGSIASISAGLDPVAAIPLDRVNTGWFDSGTISAFGLGGLRVAAKQSIATEAPLSFARGAQVEFIAPFVDIKADITARSGSVSVTNILRPDAAALTPIVLTTADGLAQLTLHAGATIDARGVWTNVPSSPDDLSGLAFVDGGSVSFTSTQDVTLASGSSIDVSSGAALLRGGKTRGGKGGDVTLIADDRSVGGPTVGGRLILDGRIGGYGANGGGKLVIGSGPSIVIGGKALATDGVLAAGETAPIPLLLAEEIVIPAGGRIPFSYDETIFNLAPGDFAAVALKVDASRERPLMVGPSGWTVPAGSFFYDVNYTYYGAGAQIAAGTKIFPGDMAKLPAGFTFTAGEFPNGIPLAATQLTFAAGDIAPVQLRFAVGTAIPAGTVASRPFAVAALTELNTNIFKTGFSSYAINGHQGLLVVDRAAIDVVTPVYRFGTAAFSAPTGSDPASALELWLPPVNLEDPVNGRMTRRVGADLMLESNLDLTRGMIAIGTDATITVDPGHAIALQSPGQITVDGQLTAAGGKIDILQVYSNGKANPFVGVQSIWLGDNALLDVAGRSAVAVDRRGHRYGLVDAGGSITLGAHTESNAGGFPPAGNGFVIMRPGARLDASGASAILDVADAVSGGIGIARPVTVATAGGSIAMSALNGFYLDGSMTAKAGGEGAPGGTLSLALVTPRYSDVIDRPTPDEVRQFRILEVAARAGGSGLASGLVWGMRDPALRFGHARIGADQVAAGGFANLSLYADTIAFDGNVSLALPQSLSISGNIVAKAGNERIDLAAPYASFGKAVSAPISGAYEPRPGSAPGDVQPGFGTMPSTQPAKTGTARLTVNADLVDLAGTFEPLNTALALADGSAALTSIAGIDQVQVVSRGDIRITGHTYGSRTLELDAAQVYPVSNSKVLVMANDLVRFGRTTSDTPALPFSVFGKLTVYSAQIEQGGILRAPLGTLVLGGAAVPGKNLVGVQKLDLLPGSITSVSAAGLAMPYGGTVDGIVYNYNGTAVTQALNGVNVWGEVVGGINLSGPSVTVASGALLDLSGGGQLLGAGFISGRGGSVDALLNPLAAANPGNNYSNLKNQVFAIVPSATGDYSPIVPASQGKAPSIVGQRITVGGGVPGLAAGTYTLMPASYALLPGAFRVELGGTVQFESRPVALANGSYITTAYGSVANTSIHASRPNQVVITPGATVRSYSQYNEQDYASFMLATAARTGQPRPSLPADAAALQLILAAQSSRRPSLSFAGQALFTPGSGGYGGVVSVDTPFNSRLEILGADSTPTAGYASVRAADLSAIGAARISLGGGQILDLDNGYVRTGGFATTVVVRGGAVLRAPEVFITAGAGGIRIEDGARIDTTGAGAATVMPSSDGYAYNAGGTGNMMVVSNGWIDMPQFTINGTVAGGISVGAATIATEGTLAFGVQSGTLSISDGMRYGARYLSLTMPNVNIGDESAIAAERAAGVLPDGLVLNQNVFGRLLAGNAVAGAPKLESLILSAQSSINFYGSLNLSTIDPATGQSSLRSLVLNTPAIYGLGAAGDSATLTTGQLVWNGINDGVERKGQNGPRSLPPGAVIAGGAGTGHGTLNIIADEVVFGYPSESRPDTQVTLDRLALGFSTVNVTGQSRITANNRNTLSVYESQGAYQTGVGYSYSGGYLNLITPMLTGDAGSINRITAGGALNVTGTGGAAAVGPAAIGAEIGLTGGTVTISSAVVLPSGKLTVSADGDIVLGDAARIDLAGRTVGLLDAVRYSWGGDVVLESTHGNIVQAAGSVIDVSAVNNRAGSLSVTAVDAAAGHVVLAGSLRGGASGHYDAGGTMVPFLAGSIDVRAQTIADFTGLNQRLTLAGMTGARSFQLKQGDLIIGDELVANSISLSVDGGRLTINGRIDASGERVGTIRLAARDGLTLGAASVLDAHGTVLRVDSYGQPIDAPNRAVVELTTTQGRLSLAPGARIDVRSADNVARGTIELNASRLGGAGGSGDGADDVAIDAAGPVTIAGARSIAVNGFRTYRPADGIVNQDLMETVHTSSTAFITAALANADLQNRLDGLRAYADAFHLRPGVEITSATPDGDLTISGDIDLSRYRYDSLNPNTAKTAIYGSGEPGRLVIRASGNLNVFGNVSDGFGAAPLPLAIDGQDTPEVARLLVKGTQPYAGDVVIPRAGVELADGTVFPRASVLNYDVSVQGFTLPANTVLPADAPLQGGLTLPAGTVVRADIRDTSGTVIYPRGTLLRQDTALPAGTVLGAGNRFVSSIVVGPMLWPKNVALPAALTLNGALTLPIGAIIPSATVVTLPDDASFVKLRDDPTPSGIWAAAPLLPQGSQSWSLRFVAGADVTAADSRALRPRSANAGSLVLADSSVMASISIQPAGWVWASVDGDNPFGTPGQPADDPWVCENLPDYCTWSPGGASALPKFALPSVVRTGTGDLELLASSDLKVRTSFGIYTAGTPSPAILAADGSNPYDLSRGRLMGSSILGPAGTSFEGLIDGGASSVYHAWYPEAGGNLLVAAQGNLTGMSNNPSGVQDGNPGNWLWRQGGNITGQQTAWWINFGTVALPQPRDPGMTPLALVGFSGFGTLGGGNVTVLAGGDAGVLASQSGGNQAKSSTALNVTVGSTGRITSDGQLILTGGGDMQVKIGGQLNPLQPTLMTTRVQSDSSGVLTNLRGLIDLQAGTIGGINVTYGAKLAADPRWPEPSTANRGLGFGGLLVIPGDAVVDLSTRGDLVLAGAADPGRVLQQNTTSYTVGGVPHDGGGTTWFTLWRNETAINLASAGGNLVPTTQNMLSNGTIDAATDRTFVYPPTLTALAASGSIYYGAYDIVPTIIPPPLTLAPSPIGQLELLASRSIYANGYAINISGADQSGLTTPFTPAFVGWQRGDITTTNVNGTGTVFPRFGSLNPGGAELFAFGPNTASNLHAADPKPALIYAASGDIVGFKSGEVVTGTGANPEPAGTWYVAAKPMQIMAGRDIVSLGTPVGTLDEQYNGTRTSNLILHTGDNDISVVSAGRDIVYANLQVAGPGSLMITAGRDIYQADQGTVTSLGPVVSGDIRSGASVLMMAGADAANYNALLRYLDPANLAKAGVPLPDQPGKVVKTYEKELADWFSVHYGFRGTDAQTRERFASLSPEQQAVFLRRVFYEELRQSGREYNDVNGLRPRSYLRGRQAIAALFPDHDATGVPIAYRGDITMFGGSGVRTIEGGDIQLLAPGGRILLGVEGVAPPSSAGLITQGDGNIDIYSQGSLLLGLSRIMTTFGGNIVAWSAEGDINAGRGSKTTQVYTPPKRVYDKYGRVKLSPSVPTTGAGIATLNPIPEVPPGNVDLIAPLGTIDAGEAGIRVSGNVNLAALQIVNAANIQVQGTSSGIPTVQAPPVGPLTAASNANAATQQAAPPPSQGGAQPSIVIVEVLGYGGGEGSSVMSPDRDQKSDERDRRSQNPDSDYQVLGAGDMTIDEARRLTADRRRQIRP
ncbi:filamentous hemagglutinin N-terminal domain-containing protein [Rhodopseudomonas boonkerdii]|uniref:filamentous hemagglutinin family protein n=1 Tax=Rhodopseudomonas boonkerdii TaxID=475937 RepID=UPI001E543058|nr:filamentous hemagglutinin family protein [Rhodopseudomonas boonkerdii]UGV26743.1 filamentous hemagglutinin N-terminal domain-containing protein [Rhodopseudomonas boonkerdii]